MHYAVFAMFYIYFETYLSLHIISFSLMLKLHIHSMDIWNFQPKQKQRNSYCCLSIFSLQLTNTVGWVYNYSIPHNT